MSLDTLLAIQARLLDIQAALKAEFGVEVGLAFACQMGPVTATFTFKPYQSESEAHAPPPFM